MRKRLLSIILFGAVALLAACGGGESTTPGGGGDNAATGGAETAAIKEGGIFRLGTTSNPDSINPFVGFSALSYILWTETYPTLVQYDTVSDSIAAHSRIRYIPQAGREMFIVFNHNLLDENQDGTFRSTRADGTVKFNYTFRF